LTGAISINAGNQHSCAVKADGRAACWGDNQFGQLGDATGGRKPVATLVPALTGATAISTGKSHTCALKADGSAACWGLNNLGQVGDGAVTNNDPALAPLTRNTSVTPVLGGAVYWK
jgi:alpha-tubulin suppressor-like RCC1 family protein